MGPDLAIVPSPQAEGFVELSTATRSPKAQGRVFRKQLLTYGDLHYPGVAGGKVKVDRDFVETVARNFREVGEIVHAPKAGPRNEHNDDPDRNVGEVIDVFADDKGLWMDLDVRTDDADKIGKTLLGASALLSLNHTNRKTQQKVGPALLHACITNRPYVTDLEPFQEVIAMSAPGADITTEAVVLTQSDEEIPMKKEELIEALKEHGVDVAALTEKAELGVALSAKIKDAFGGNTDVIALTAGEEATSEVLLTAIESAADKIVELTASVDTLEDEKLTLSATAEVEKLVSGGYIYPSKKDAMVKLSKSDHELFLSLVPEKPVVKLSVEEGADPIDPSVEKTAKDEIDRLVKLSTETSAASGAA